ncbi:7-deoxyloganetin glucosyltransferase-like [Alnus glutinosa]|uniref:7-deoxyloganetin glucosyltransferase-like n=1 Tax=Alnus glutinosa TaxID=3517 RepID=UPI002D7902D3|nr:7-deoxyloganetin glucosyltransferase-like [Alnus glutinosa]
MDSKIVEATDKPHAVCIPYPMQSHIKAMLKFAKLLHGKGFHITFVNTEFNHQRFLKSRDPKSLDGLPDFQFKTIPDSLPPSDSNASQDSNALCESVMKNFLAPFSDILVKLNTTTSNNLPVTCIISDAVMAFTYTAGRELGIPVVMLFAISASSLMDIMQSPLFTEKGLTPLKDPNDHVLKVTIQVVETNPKAAGIVVHTFDALEQEALDALSPMFPRVYAIGPQQLLLNHLPNDPLKSTGYSLWKEETECLDWLNSKAPNSVIYVNFGSVIVITPQQLVGFAWGLANSNFMFLWIIRPDLVVGDSAILPREFVEETKGRGLIASWCPQEEVLNHSSIGGFLTHCGWNSIMESLCAGVPMLCCPFDWDQPRNCKYACNEWGIGMEIDKGAKRGELEKIVRELMEGNKGKKMKQKVMEWKKLAEEATGPHGSSSINLDKLVNEVLLSKA